jgi:hypothetical protein
LKFQEMQVDIEPFPMNMIDFEGKRVLTGPAQPIREKAKKSSSTTHGRPMKIIKILAGK